MILVHRTPEQNALDVKYTNLISFILKLFLYVNILFLI